MKSVQVYTAKSFYDTYKVELLKKEAVYQLLITNILNAMENSTECLIGAIEEEKHPYLFFQYTRPYHMLIHEVNDVNESIIRLLLDYLKSEKIAIDGINTTAKIAEMVLTVGQIKDYTIKTKMDIMELKKEQLIEQKTVGKLVVATNEDLELGLKWYGQFYLDCFNEVKDSCTYEENMRNHIKHQNFFFYEVEGKKVAMACINRELFSGAAVSLVFTAPEFRGFGYCKELMSEVAKAGFNRGYEFLCLFVDKNNPVSNRVYKDVGYQIKEDKIDIGFTI